MPYSPKIKEELVRKLYLLKHSSSARIPMTKMVNEAVEKYIKESEIKNENRKSDNFDSACPTDEIVLQENVR